MNERIRQLAEQAKDHANTYDDTGTPIWFQMYNEKFAELIVRECAKRVDYWESRQGEHADDLLKHFGVGE